MLKYVILVFAVLGLCAWNSCEQKGKEPDNQIVVIGNGMNWANAVLADVKTSAGTSSMVVDQDKTSSLGSALIPTKANEAAPAVQLDWVIPDGKGSVLVKLKNNLEINFPKTTSDLQAVEGCLFFEGPVTGPAACKKELHDSDIAKAKQVSFMKSGALLFVDENEELRISTDRKSSLRIGAGINFFDLDSNDNLFFSEAGSMRSFYLSQANIQKANYQAILFSENGTLFKNSESAMLLFLNGRSSGMSEGLDPKSLYRFDAATEKFERLLNSSSVEIQSLQLPALNLNQISVVTAKVQDARQSEERWAVLKIGNASITEISLPSVQRESLRLNGNGENLLIDSLSKNNTHDFLFCKLEATPTAKASSSTSDKFESAPGSSECKPVKLPPTVKAYAAVLSHDQIILAIKQCVDASCAAQTYSLMNKPISDKSPEDFLSEPAPKTLSLEGPVVSLSFIHMKDKIQDAKEASTKENKSESIPK